MAGSFSASHLQGFSADLPARAGGPGGRMYASIVVAPKRKRRDSVRACGAAQKAPTGQPSKKLLKALELSWTRRLQEAGSVRISNHLLRGRASVPSTCSGISGES